MREVPLEVLRDETVRLRGIITGTKILHPSGPRLHRISEPITVAQIQALMDLGITHVVFLEPGEDESAIQKRISIERVDPETLMPGDTIVEEVPGPEGKPVAAAGTAVDAETLVRVRGAMPGPVAIRKRGHAIASAKVKEYHNRFPLPAKSIMATDTRVTRMTSVSSIRVRPLIMPRAKILVSVPDEFLRSLLVNTLATAGHDVVEGRVPAEAPAQALGSRADLVMMDLPESQALIPKFRESESYRNLGILVTAEEGRQPEARRALAAGANEILEKPPRRDILLERVRGCLQALGKAVRLKPSVQADRRTLPRGPASLACVLKDPILMKPMPVSTAPMMDMSDTGMRIEYSNPDWGSPWAYTSHGVHPKHFLFSYAKGNPLARYLTVEIPSTSGKAKEVFAHVAYVRLQGLSEVAGFSFQSAKGHVTDHFDSVKK